MVDTLDSHKHVSLGASNGSNIDVGFRAPLDQKARIFILLKERLMADDEKVLVTPNGKMVEDLMGEIDDLLCEKESIVIDAITALMGVIITRTLEAGIPKANVLRYFSNTWELNDPENDHPDRDKSVKVRH